MQRSFAPFVIRRRSGEVASAIVTSFREVFHFATSGSTFDPGKYYLGRGEKGKGRGKRKHFPSFPFHFNLAYLANV